jgi:hypothetical protein
MTAIAALERLLVSRDRAKTVGELDLNEINIAIEWFLRRGTELGYFDNRELLLLLAQRFDFALVDLTLADEYRTAPSLVEPVLESRVMTLTRAILGEVPGARLVSDLIRRTKVAARRLDNVGAPRDDVSVVEAAVRVTGELRCAYCGYHFRENDVRQSLLDQARLDSSSLAPALHPKRQADRWKPVSTKTKKGEERAWTGLEIDHRVPEAALGENVPENLAIACTWCNRGKRMYQSFAEAIPSLLAVSLGGLPDELATELIARAFYAVVNRSRVCMTCGATPLDAELTVVATHPLAGLRRPFEAHPICYSCC